MKNIVRFFSMLLALVILGSCDDNLDLQPEQSLSPGIVLSNEANLQNLLVGIYDEAAHGSVEAVPDNTWGGEIYTGMELYANAGDLMFNGTFEEPAEFNEKVLATTNAWVTNFWLNAYEVSNQTNLVIENLGVVEDEATKNRMEGEAKFLRALVYFDLVKSFGLPYEAGGANSQDGVPIVLTGVTDAAQVEAPSRNTVAEVYAQVVADLNSAVSLLPETNGEFADRYSAQALLARVYLQQGNYAAARDAAHAVLQNSGHSLAPEFSGAFNNAEDGVEDLFAWQITSQDGTNDFNTYWAGSAFGGRSGNPDVAITAAHMTIYDDPDNDARAAFFYENNGGTATTKWQSEFGNIPFLRIAEMHLIRAEGNFREGTALGLSPEAEINALRGRSGAVAIAGLSLQNILDERKRELAFEGHNLHDRKRLQENIGSLPYNDPSLVMPIPQRERDANSNLSQNPGYAQ